MKKTLFDRAAEALQSGNSRTSEALIADLTQLAAAELPDLEATAGPESVLARDSGGRILGQRQTLAGERYRTAALAADTSALQAVLVEHARLAERRATMLGLIHDLEQRAKAEAGRERQETAPAMAKQIVADLDGAMDELAAAATVYGEQRAAVERMVQTLAEQRTLSADCPALTVDQFARLGDLLAHRLSRGEHLFNSLERAKRLDYALLAGPPATLFTRLRKRLGAVSTLSYQPRQPTAQDERLEEQAYRHERLRLLARGDLDAAAKLAA